MAGKHGNKEIAKVHGRTDLGLLRKVKGKMDQRSINGSNPEPVTYFSKDEKARSYILAKMGNIEANQGSNIGIGDNTNENMKSEHKKINDLGPSKKTSDGVKVRHGAVVGLSKVNYEIDGQIRKEDATREKSKRHNGRKKNKSSDKSYDERISCSENRAINDGVKESIECENEQGKNTKKGKRNEITDFNFLKNSSSGVTNLKDAYGDLMGNEKDEKLQNDKKENCNSSENSTSTGSCNLDMMAKEHDKKKKMTDYFLESKGGEDSINKKVKKSGNACSMISESGAHMVPSSVQRSKKRKKRENTKEDIAGCPGYILEATTEVRGNEAIAATTSNYDENSKVDVNTLNVGKDSNINGSHNCELKKDAKKGKKKVTFSNKIEEFPLSQSSHKEFNSVNLVRHQPFTKEDEPSLVWGKWFTREEDELIRKATEDYIEANQLGEQGLHMILHSSMYRKQVKDCWKVIASALPWRPRKNIYFRAHTLFEKNVEHRWEPEDFELLKRYYAQNGPDWKKFADIFGKSRLQVKDTYRSIKAANLKKGKWGQGEYQALFDLVNLDLRMKAFQEKKNSHAVLKNNISWESISTELSTRGPQACCLKWYFQLTSSMVSEGHWSDLDDYKMISAIQETDPSCFEDIDWDSLLENRSGEICRKRWYEMIKYLDRFWVMPFVEQIDLLSQRYCPEMVPYMQKDLNTNPLS